MQVWEGKFFRLRYRTYRRVSLLAAVAYTHSPVSPNERLGEKDFTIPRVDGDYDLKTPKDMAYVFSGAYTPLSCKLIEHVLMRKSWTGLEEVTRLLNSNEFSEQLSERNSFSDSNRTIVVVFLGGCTFSEISALRFLGKDIGCKFVFLTTAITNGARLLESMTETKS
ncbi:unnamed protein product [Ranitomeya imitator]|uniref:Vacuolar protein sorting-associated protein 33B n=1 Tax=Ranitomeya imitator TaxID=111125 RepID=A0ABN9M1I0_9NEOB|nr:unnamed protein product [Ranitomeya imitator]